MRSLASVGTEFLQAEHHPYLVVINLGSADYAAHAFGRDSPYYLRTIEYQDALRGEQLAVLQSLGLGERTAVVISADHGFTQVADMAPTVLRLLGLPGVKLNPDGRVREEVLAR